MLLKWTFFQSAGVSSAFHVRNATRVVHLDGQTTGGRNKHGCQQRTNLGTRLLARPSVHTFWCVVMTGRSAPDLPAPSPGSHLPGSPAFYRTLADSDLPTLMTLQHVRYDPSYYFPWPIPTAMCLTRQRVCTDVVVRAYHRDWDRPAAAGPRGHEGPLRRVPGQWGLFRTGHEHRPPAVPNLMTFFGRHGRPGPVGTPRTTGPATSCAGTWAVAPPHRHPRERRLGRWHPALVIHNIGAGQC